MARLVACASCAFAAAIIWAAAAQADVLKVRDEAGAEMDLDTTELAGCKIVFDSAGAPFEICRMRRVEITPPRSTRSRPGSPVGEEAADERPKIVYTKAVE